MEVRHVYVAQGHQQPAPRDGLFPQGGGKEATPPGGGGGVFGDIDGDHCIWNPPLPGHLLQVPWEIPLDGERRLASGGPQPLKGAAEVGVAVYGAEQGRCVCPYLKDNLHGGGSFSDYIQVGDVGDDTAHWEVFGRIPPHGGPQADGKTTLERTGRWMGVSPARGSNYRGDLTGSGYLRLSPP